MKKNKDREFIAWTGKQGYINFKRAFLKEIGASDEVIEKYVKELEDKLPEGPYKIS